MSTAPRLLGAGVVLGLAAGLLAGVALAGSGLTTSDRALAAAPTATPTASLGAGPVGAPSVGIPQSGPAISASGPAVSASGVGVAQSGPAVAASGTTIAYPYFGGSPGIAPDHTIVVTGVGQADLTADGSNRTSAQKSALAAALADARAQADAIASATGLSISGVLSVSASVSPSYGIYPMAAGGSGMPACLPGAPETGSKTSDGTTVPQPACPPYPQVLSASVTVAYEVG